MNFRELIERIKGKDNNTNISFNNEESKFVTIKNFCFKYKYILLAVFIGIILISIVSIVVKNQTSKSLAIEEIQQQEEEIMRIALENKQKEEEEKKIKEELEKQREKEEEENATGVIYLTFDDGPTADSTPQVLDILEQNNVKATFFVIHYSEQNEHLIKREKEQGHTIALHGYSHTYSVVYQSADSCLENFRKIGEQVYQTTGINSKIIRFPGGLSNTVSRKYCEGVMTELSQRAIDEGYRIFDWNVDSDDAGRAKTSDDIYNNVTSKLKPGRNNVVLMHDFAGNHKTIDALQGIINFGKENGYVFRKITEETEMVMHHVNN